MFYPNPFNSVTEIKYSILENIEITIRIYDINGNMTEELLNQTMNVGYHQIEWNGENLSSGTYFIRINSGEFSVVKKLGLVK